MRGEQPAARGRTPAARQPAGGRGRTCAARQPAGGLGRTCAAKRLVARDGCRTCSRAPKRCPLRATSSRPKSVVCRPRRQARTWRRPARRECHRRATAAARVIRTRRRLARRTRPRRRCPPAPRPCAPTRLRRRPDPVQRAAASDSARVPHRGAAPRARRTTRRPRRRGRSAAHARVRERARAGLRPAPPAPRRRPTARSGAGGRRRSSNACSHIRRTDTRTCVLNASCWRPRRSRSRTSDRQPRFRRGRRASSPSRGGRPVAAAS